MVHFATDIPTHTFILLYATQIKMFRKLISNPLCDTHETKDTSKPDTTIPDWANVSVFAQGLREGVRFKIIR